MGIWRGTAFKVRSKLITVYITAGIVKYDTGNYIESHTKTIIHISPFCVVIFTVTKVNRVFDKKIRDFPHIQLGDFPQKYEHSIRDICRE